MSATLSRVFLGFLILCIVAVQGIALIHRYQHGQGLDQGTVHTKGLYAGVSISGGTFAGTESGAFPQHDASLCQIIDHALVDHTVVVTPVVDIHPGSAWCFDAQPAPANPKTDPRLAFLARGPPVIT